MYINGLLMKSLDVSLPQQNDNRPWFSSPFGWVWVLEKLKALWCTTQGSLSANKLLRVNGKHVYKLVPVKSIYIYCKCYNKPAIFYFRRPRFLLSFVIKSPSLPLLSSNNSLFILLPWLAWASSLALLVSLFSPSYKNFKKKKKMDTQSHAPLFLLFSISSSKQLLCVLYFSCYLFAGNITAMLLYASPM